MDTTAEELEWESVNHTIVNSLGMELSGRLNLSQLMPAQKLFKSLSVAYSYIDQDKDLESNLQSLYALEYLRHKLVGSIDMHLVGKLDMYIAYRFQERTGSFTNTYGYTENYAPYSVWDTKLSWNDTHYNIYVEANNIFDKDYVDYGNVRQPGAWIVGGAIWKF